MAVKMASRKKKMPSIPNGRPRTAPYWRISPGHSRPISNDSTVPVTAPTATSTPITCDQRRASFIAMGSGRRSPMNSAISTIVGSAMPRQARMMWKPSVVAICARAGITCPLTCGAVAARTSLSCITTHPDHSLEVSVGCSWSIIRLCPRSHRAGLRLGVELRKLAGSGEGSGGGGQAVGGSGEVAGGGQAFEEFAGQPKQLLLGGSEVRGHGLGQPGVALAHVTRQGEPAGLRDGEQRAPAVVRVGLAEDPAGGFETGQGAGQRLGLDPLRGRQFAGRHRATAVEVGQDAQLEQRFTRIGSLHPQPAAEAGHAAADGAGGAERVVIRAHKSYASTYFNGGCCSALTVK